MVMMRPRPDSVRAMTTWAVGATLIALAVPGAWCAAKEKYTATLSYTVAPKQPLPEGLKAVAVLDSGVQAQGANGDDREAKWSTIAADMIEAMLQSGSAMSGTPLAVAKRRDTKKILVERDLKLSGLVDGPTATRAGKLLAVQGLITSKITVRIDVQKGTKSTVDWVSMMGGVTRQLQESRDRRDTKVRRDPRYVRDPRYTRDPRYAYDPRYRDNRTYQQKSTAAGGGFQMKTKDVEEISRHLTVQCSFALMDATTGQAIAQYSPPPYQKKDKASPNFLFGSSMSEADLDPVDHFIGELVERATQEFVGMLVPVRIDCKYELVGKGKPGEAGIRALRADDYKTAIEQFQAELAKKPKEHETAFAMGVAYELAGDREQALECYRRAASMEGVDKDTLPVYLAAKERLTDHIGRIVQPSATPPAVPPVVNREAPPATPAPPSAPSAPPVEQREPARPADRSAWHFTAASSSPASQPTPPAASQPASPPTTTPN